jgi:hypothetical protein
VSDGSSVFYIPFRLGGILLIMTASGTSTAIRRALGVQYETCDGIFSCELIEEMDRADRPSSSKDRDSPQDYFLLSSLRRLWKTTSNE